MLVSILQPFALAIEFIDLLFSQVNARSVVARETVSSIEPALQALFGVLNQQKVPSGLTYADPPRPEL